MMWGNSIFYLLEVDYTPQEGAACHADISLLELQGLIQVEALQEPVPASTLLTY